MFRLNYVLPRDEKLLVSHNNIILVAIFLIIPLFVLIYLHNNKKIRAFSATVIMMMAVAFTVITNVLPIVYNAGPQDLVSFAQLSNTPAFSSEELLTYGLIKPSIIFYSQKRVPKLETEKDFYGAISGKQPVLVIVRNKHLKELLSKFSFHIIKKGAKYSLISNCSMNNQR
jgi:hypothetical protein